MGSYSTLGVISHAWGGGGGGGGVVTQQVT